MLGLELGIVFDSGLKLETQIDVGLKFDRGAINVGTLCMAKRLPLLMIYINTS